MAKKTKTRSKSHRKRKRPLAAQKRPIWSKGHFRASHSPSLKSARKSTLTAGSSAGAALSQRPARMASGTCASGAVLAQKFAAPAANTRSRRHRRRSSKQGRYAATMNGKKAGLCPAFLLQGMLAGVRPRQRQIAVLGAAPPAPRKAEENLEERTYANFVCSCAASRKRQKDSPRPLRGLPPLGAKTKKDATKAPLKL